MASALRFRPPPISHRRSTQSPPPPPIPNPNPCSPRRAAAGLSARYRSSSTVHGPSLPDPPDAGDDLTFDRAVSLFNAGDDLTFDRAVSLFNAGDYHRCHDCLEELWTGAEEPIRIVLHGILQCAVGFHHLFNQNHRGAMMELGEGLCKLRKMGFKSGPLFRFEKEISDVLEFVYQTQMELAACSDDLCVTMDGSERSYQLLGSFAAGQHLYSLDIGSDGIPYIIFCQNHHDVSDKPLRIRVPTLTASEEHLKACEYMC